MTHTKDIHGGALVCQYCQQSFRKQRYLKRHYKYCSEESKQELEEEKKSRENLDDCFWRFFKKKEKQTITKGHEDNKLSLGSRIPKRRIHVPTPPKYRHRSINKRANLIPFFE